MASCIMIYSELAIVSSSYSACLVSLQKHKSGRNKGFGFTTFEAEADLERTLQASAHDLILSQYLTRIHKLMMSTVVWTLSEAKDWKSGET